MTPAVTTVLRRQPSVILDRHARKHLLKLPWAKKAASDSRRHGVSLCAKQSVPMYDPDGYKARIRQVWDKRALSYDSELTWRAPMNERLVALAELMPGATRVLDVASGTGSVALLAAQILGPEGSVSALDVSEAMITKAREKAAEANIAMQFFVQDVETASFPDGSFDCILCSNAMPYLQHPQATLRKFHSWLSPGSLLCFSTPLAPLNPLADIVRRLVGGMSGEEIADMAGFFGTPETIADLCKAAGFRKIQITCTEEQKLCTNTTAEQYAEQVLRMMTTFPIKPVGQLLSTSQMQELKASYMPEAIPMAERMRTKSGDIDVRFRIQWVVARC